MAQTKVQAPFVEGGGGSSFKNLFINGDMKIYQRGAASTPTASGTFALDRWKLFNVNAGAFSVSQDTTVPTGEGFTKSVKWDCTTADGSLAAGDLLIIQQRFEGQMLQHLKKGTSNAEKTTVSFWVRSAKTGTHIVEMYDADNTRQISKIYTINSADTWEKKEIVFEGDTSGALGNDNGHSLQVNWWFAAGSTYAGGTLNTSWAANTNANRAVGQVNLADNTNNNFYLTGVQLEVGDLATDFEHLPFDVQLHRCMRYLEILVDPRSLGTGTLSTGDTNEGLGNFVNYNAQYAYGHFDFKVTKRSETANLESADGTNYFKYFNENTSDLVDVVQNVTTEGHHGIQVYLDCGSGAITQGNGGFVRVNNAAATLLVEDEL